MPNRPPVTTPELTTRYCPVCRTTATGAFKPGPGGRPDASCPNCRSLERQRFLAILLDGLAPVLHGVDVLVDVAPSPQTSPLYRALSPQSYLRLDFDPSADGRDVDVRASLTDLPLASASVGVMICYHVLEHIPDDAAAMREIARVLSSDGLAVVQVPWRPSRATDEDPTAGVEERVRRFGRADHVRYYGTDFEDRLRRAGLDVRRIAPRALVGPTACNWMNLQPEEAVWLLRPADAPRSVDATVQPTGALAASFEQLLAYGTAIEQMLVAARTEADSARAEARRWRQRFKVVNDHWVMRSYRTFARPAGRVLGRRS